MKPLIEALQALSDPLRLRILGILDTTGVCVTDIYSVLGISQPNASKQLGVLRRAGLVETRREGLWTYYRVGTPADPGVAAILEAAFGASRQTAACIADRQRLDRRSRSVVVPQSWHGTDPEFLD